MVFAPNAPLGFAKVFICQRQIDTFAELVAEAEALWLAESPDGSPRPKEQTLSASWGCVGLLINPQKAVSVKWLNAWAQRIALERRGKGREQNYESERYLVDGRSALSNRGMIQIDWPIRADTNSNLEGVDILLATVTKPTSDPTTGSYPEASAIAEAWNKSGNSIYFRSNVQHGFLTFQDKEISSLLRV